MQNDAGEDETTSIIKDNYWVDLENKTVTNLAVNDGEKNTQYKILLTVDWETKIKHMIQSLGGNSESVAVVPRLKIGMMQNASVLKPMINGRERTSVLWICDYSRWI